MSVSASSETLNNGASTDLEHDIKVDESALPNIPMWQNPMSLTLDSSQIWMSTLGLIASILFLGSQTTIIAVSTIPVLLWIYNDYNNYLGLGPGGTPSTFKGYLKINYLKLWQLRDPFTARKPVPNMKPAKGILAKQPLPFRMGPKPNVVGIAPHRQTNQHGAPWCYLALRKTLKQMGVKNPKMFGTECSFIEKNGLALFARHPIETRYQGEVCHIHDAEYSMHMALHPDDSKEVLKKGWGQRHPLGWEWWFLKMPVSADFVMVYAPRTEEELRTICRIIEGAIWYTTAEEVEVEVFLK